MKKFISVCCCGLISLAASLSAYAYTNSSSTNTFTGITVFGDSLTDLGVQNNNPINKGNYKRSIYTTPGARVWAEYLANQLNLRLSYNNSDFQDVQFPNPYVDILSGGGNNYAAGGATTTGTGIPGNCEGSTTKYCYFPPSLATQVQSFIKTSTTQNVGHKLYVIWIGANNIFKALAAKNPTPTSMTKAATKAATDTETQIALLRANAINGKDYNPQFLVVNMPNLGNVPAATTPGAKNLLTLAANTYNTTLHSWLVNSSVHAFYANSYKMLDNIISNPAHSITVHGRNITFANVTVPACGLTGKAITCLPDTSKYNYLFEDAVHPTGLGQYVLGSTITDCVTKYPSGTHEYCEAINPQ